MIVRHIVEISEDDVTTYQSCYLTTMSNDFELASAKLEMLAPSLRPERPLAQE